MQSYYSFLFVSTDAGDTWAEKTVRTYGDVQPTCIAADGSNIFLGVYTGAQFSTNSGTDWRVISTDMVIRSALFLHETFVAGSAYGEIFLSSDNGETWATADTGLPLSSIWSLASNDSDLFVGTFGDGVWSRPLSELGLLPKEEIEEVPTQFFLSQNYPNPFNPSTTISFTIPQSSIVNLKIFDLLGQEVETIVNERFDTGSYSRQWDATDQPSGVYFYRLQAGDFTETKKLILLR